MFSDYASLQQTVEKYLDYAVDGMIPVFIGLAEKRMERDARLRAMERRATQVTTAGDEGLALPDKREPGDWDVYLNMREISLRAMPPVNLEYVTPDEYTNIAAASGRPRVYTIVGRDLLLAPRPDAAYTIALAYYAQIPPLSDAQPTNDVLLSYPDLYLYATLAESVPYARSSVPGDLWGDAYMDSLSAAKNADAKARYSRQITAKPPRRFYNA